MTEKPLPDTEHSTLRRHDLVIAAIVWCIALAVFIESWGLTFGLELPGVDPDKAWLVAPGLFPLLLSAGLLFMFSIVISVAFKEGEFDGHFSKNKALNFVRDAENTRQIIQIALLCIYVFVLIGKVYFGVASALYLCAAMLTARAAKWYVILIISVVFAASVSYLFGTVMKINLP